jgi:CheY-like chemotaxis protein
LTRLEGAPLPDAIVIDFGLPDLRGDELHRRIRILSRSVPIIIASGYGESSEIHALLSDIHTRFIQKPYDVDQLVTLLAESTG